MTARRLTFGFILVALTGARRRKSRLQTVPILCRRSSSPSERNDTSRSCRRSFRPFCGSDET